MSAQTAQDLRAAAQVLRRDGWTQDTYADEQGCKCLYGAITYAISGGECVSEGELRGDEMTRFVTARAAAVNTVGVADGLDLIDWNDEPGRTADQVIAALEAAATTAEQA